jgi:TonB family protein
MNNRKSSRTFITFMVLLALVTLAIVLITTPSCNRVRRGEVRLSELEPPLLPPPPPAIPTMNGSDTTWEIVDEIPMFPGGAELLGKYIAMNTKYPEEAKAKGITGKVIVKFRITSKGKVNACQIYKSAAPELDAEALRVVKSIERFEPAIVDGKPVSAWFYMPIVFALK